MARSLEMSLVRPRPEVLDEHSPGLHVYQPDRTWPKCSRRMMTTAGCVRDPRPEPGLRWRLEEASAMGAERSVIRLTAFYVGAAPTCCAYR